MPEQAVFTRSEPAGKDGNLRLQPQRVLGKTGERVPLIGLGTGPGGFGLTDEEAIALYHRAIDLGVTLIDTAPGYQRAEKQLGEVMRKRRAEVLLVTKTWAATADKALESLKQSLQRLQTDHVDVVYVHSVGDYQEEVEFMLSDEGSFAGLREAQRRGWTRYVGFSAHCRAWRAAEVLRRAEIDVIMLALNFVDRHTYRFEDEVLPLARGQDTGILAMKVYGGARDMKYDTPRPSALGNHGPHDHEKALRYSLGLPGVAAAVVGVYSERELKRNIEWALRWQPLDDDEERELMALGQRIAQDWGTHFGAAE